ncbi:MAG: C40 family peptidase [Paenibacillus macerans]|uniref:NlpC/P60 family protein n=1 Tax=Paenibacillus macerans TaxID=44252 RepID=A0A6N8F636_PAEMA|nr:C40 family peptidase [Paenibacillus macerans]MBS5913932.1 C40 family peptidase [Paenibacillus macerans]MCY7559266.1 C40 family peptidase [Paenibacillus macerans]MDU5946256.1 C40 family peptidase [Paenibacillus macerans]MDU7476233.1 C40 family peptidase [Paenibacillus macerans]MEC0137232.1 C40 family peptidase [Paenibacillus macerans]
MRKTLAAAVTSLALCFSLGTGSAFADEQETSLSNIVNSVYGTPYKYGGTSTAGFDCSGFTRYVFEQMGVTLPRVSTAQYKVGTPVSKSKLQAGDLVFFNTLGGGKVSHVGVYVGDGEFAHASSSKGIRIDKLSSSYYQNRFVGAKRVLSKYGYSVYAAES